MYEAQGIYEGVLSQTKTLENTLYVIRCYI